MKRQLDDYYDRFYHKLENRYESITANELQPIRTLLRWKERVMANWQSITCINKQTTKIENDTLYVGEGYIVDLHLRLGALSAEDVKVELLFASTEEDGHMKLAFKCPFHVVSEQNGVTHFRCELNATNVGLWSCAVRVIPQHELLPHDLDFNLVRWM